MELNLVHVRSFLAVVDFGGYHRASEALHLSQPSVSQHVRRLEAQLGGTLFERDGRGVRLTPRGDAAVCELRRLIEAHDRAVARLSRERGGEGPFVLGVVEHLADPVVPQLLATLRDRLGPQRQVQLRIDRSRALVDAVQAGDVDAAVVVDTVGAPRAVELASLPLHWWGEATAAARPLPDPLPVVAYTEPCGLRDQALAQLTALGIHYEITTESPHLSGIQTAVRAGMGFSLLAGGSDGMRRVTSGPLSEASAMSLSLVVADAYEQLGDVLRRALWNATLRARPRAAA